MSSDFLKTWPHKSGRLFFLPPARGNLHTLEEGKDEKFPTFSDARSWWCRRTPWEKGASNLFHYMSAFKGYFRNPDTQHTYKPANYSVPDLYSNEPLCANARRARGGDVHAGQKSSRWYLNKSLFTHRGTGSCSWVRIQCIRGHMLPRY